MVSMTMHSSLSVGDPCCVVYPYCVAINLFCFQKYLSLDDKLYGHCSINWLAGRSNRNLCNFSGKYLKKISQRSFCCFYTWFTLRSEQQLTHYKHSKMSAIVIVITTFDVNGQAEKIQAVLWLTFFEGSLGLGVLPGGLRASIAKMQTKPIGTEVSLTAVTTSATAHSLFSIASRCKKTTANVTFCSTFIGAEMFDQ